MLGGGCSQGVFFVVKYCRISEIGLCRYEVHIPSSGFQTATQSSDSVSCSEDDTVASESRCTRSRGTCWHGLLNVMSFCLPQSNMKTGGFPYTVLNWFPGVCGCLTSWARSGCRGASGFFTSGISRCCPHETICRTV